MARFRCFAKSQPRPFLFFSRRAFSFWWWSALVMQGNFALIFPCTSAPFWHAHLFAIHWISRSLLARAPVRSSLNMNTYTPHPKKNISHRIYTIHVGHLFWFQNGEFRRKVTSLHPWLNASSSIHLSLNLHFPIFFAFWTSHRQPRNGDTQPDVSFCSRRTVNSY